MSEFYQGIFIGVMGGLVYSFVIDMIQTWRHNRKSNAEWSEKVQRDRDKVMQDMLDRQEIG